MNLSLKTKLGILLPIGVLLVMTIIILSSFWASSLQNDYTVVINLSGRQRMLTQKMTKEILWVVREKEGKESGDGYKESLRKTIYIFDKTLDALANGGETIDPGGKAVKVPALSNPEILKILKSSSALWKEFHTNLGLFMEEGVSLDSDEFRKALAFIEANNGKLLDAMNDVAVLYEKEAKEKLSFFATIQVWAFIVTVIMGAVAYWVTESIIIRPLSKMAVSLQDITKMGVSEQPLIGNGDEIGNMIATIEQMAANLQNMREEIGNTASNVASASEQISSATEDLTAGAEIQSASIDMTSVSIEEINASMREIAGNTSELSSSAEKAAASTSEIAESIDKVAGIAEELANTVDEVASSITDMARSVKEITEHTSQLSNFTADTAAAVSEINSSIIEVEGSLSISAKLAEATEQDAEAGREAVKNTIDGMNRIRETVDDAARGMEKLNARSEAIGDILNVINEVAKQTSLLALNAAIIAAQAGDHGKGFSVVADEIKDLAGRTTESTREIESLIKAVQSESANVVKSMGIGRNSVEKGFELSQRAGEALDKILSSANSSRRMVGQITRASEEQRKGSQLANNSMEKITEMIRKVCMSIEDHERGSANIADASVKMKEAAFQVKNSTSEQSHNGKIISKAMENITEVIYSIDRGTQEQAKGSQEVAKSILEIRGIIDKNIDDLMKLSEVMEIMSAQTEILENAIKKFNT